MKTRGTKRRMAGAGSEEETMAERTAELADCPNPADFSGCWILTGSQEFIRRTFAFLPARTLIVCSRVCKAWQTVAKRTLHQREEIGWATYGRLQAEAQAADNCLDPLGPFGVHLDQCLESIGSLPKLAIVFSGCWPLSGQQSNGRAKRKTSLIGDLQARFPADSSVACVVGCGTVGCQSDLSPAGESEDDQGVSCALLPRMDGVSVHCEWHSLDLFGPATSSEYLRAHRLPADTRCVLVFQDSPYRMYFSYAQALQRDLYDAYGTRPTICGGIARQLLLHPESGEQYRSPRRSGHAVTITFSGPRVRAASVVLDHWVSTRAQVRERLGRLKTAVGLADGRGRGRSLAFMFSCVARGRSFYREPDVESAAFHELFPDTPLLGFFGSGEYGCDNLTCGRPASNDLPNLDLAQTCVFCLISFG